MGPQIPAAAQIVGAVFGCSAFYDLRFLYLGTRNRRDRRFFVKTLRQKGAAVNIGVTSARKFERYAHHIRITNWPIPLLAEQASNAPVQPA